MKKLLLVCSGFLLFSSTLFSQENNVTPRRKAPDVKVVTSNGEKIERNVGHTSTPGVAESKSTAGSNTHELPDDFPKYIDTGNPEKDAADYRKRKEAWIEANPQRYKARFAQPSTTPAANRKAQPTQIK